MFSLSIQLLLIKHAASIFHGRLLIKFVYPTELKSVKTSNLCTVQKALKWANRPSIRLLKSGSQSTQKLQSHCSITLICSRFIAFLSLFGAVFIRPIFNKQIKKYSKRKEQFPNEESLERFLVSQFDQYNQRFATRCHIGFDQARAELQMMFKTN